MAESLPEKINKIYSNYLNPQTTIALIDFLLTIARKRHPYTYELSKYFKISEEETKKFCDYFIDQKIVKERENGKGMIIELDKKGETLFRKINVLSRHKNQIEIINCPKCNKIKPKSTHHILPRKHFGNNPFTIDLCQKCHNEIGKLVHDVPKMSPEEYMRITVDFMYGTEGGKKKKKVKFKGDKIYCQTRSRKLTPEATSA